MANIRTPKTTSTTFDLGGNQTPRPKGLFVVHFRPNEGGTNSWQRDIGFLVKSIEQPSITPKTEEVNQYNKKRQIHTGYTVNPVNISIYDTADGAALQMWNEYAKYYFGDFSQTESNYGFDQTVNEMLGEDIGYGFLGADQNFFAGIDIYQVFRNAYTKTTLINPKITSFSPEELDYERMETSMFRFSVIYETILYHNNGTPASLDSDEVLSAAFQDIRLHGDILEVTGPAAPPITSSSTNINDAVDQKSGLSSLLGGLGILPTTVSSLTTSGLGGVLSSFGKFDVAKGLASITSSVVSGNTNNALGKAVMASTGNSQLATIVGSIATGQSSRTIATQVLNGALNSGLNPQTYQLAQATINAASGNKNAQGALAGAAVKAVMGSALMTGTSVQSQVTSNKSGLSLSGSAMSLLNASISPLAKLGKKL